MTPKRDSDLIAYWITFPNDSHFPVGFGVTAWSIEDAYRLLEERGFYFHQQASRVAIRENITVDDIDYSHVAVNAGPIIVRGVWYPCFNIGYGAP